jgi:hypothetical protein
MGSPARVLLSTELSPVTSNSIGKNHNPTVCFDKPAFLSQCGLTLEIINIFKQGSYSSSDVSFAGEMGWKRISHLAI